MLRYSIPLHRITLRHFFDLTKEKKMLPGRVMLQQNMEERFSQLSKLGIANLAHLIRILGSKAKLEEFAQQIALQTREMCEIAFEENSSVGSGLSEPAEAGSRVVPGQTLSPLRFSRNSF